MDTSDTSDIDVPCVRINITLIMRTSLTTAESKAAMVKKTRLKDGSYATANVKKVSQ